MNSRDYTFFFSFLLFFFFRGKVSSPPSPRKNPETAQAPAYKHITDPSQSQSQSQKTPAFRPF